jgi:4-hydroxymandelate oxidase
VTSDVPPDVPADVPADVATYVADGLASGETRGANRRALDRWRIVPRVLNDVSAVTSVITLLGREAALPLVVAPMAAQRLVDPTGELAMARAAAAAGVPFVLSLSSTVPVEDIGSVPGIDLLFQLYPFADRDLDRQVVERACAAGARAIVLTVDLPPPGRSSSLGGGVSLPPGVAYAHHADDPMSRPRVTWDDLADLVGWAGVPVVVKGVMHGDDARRAASLGAAAVVVSNHGGRVLDGVLGAADALADLGPMPVPVLLDGGIASGVDVFRAVALGATAAMVGRTALWALAAGGEAAVRQELERIHVEFERALAVAGAGSVAAVGRECVRPSGLIAP